MIKLLTIYQELESARELGYPTFTYLYDAAENYIGDIIIRWGNSNLIYNEKDQLVDFKNVLNTSSAIDLNCQKHLALKKLSEVVLVPKIYDEIPTNKLLVIRPHRHTCGDGFRIVKGPYIMPQDHYAIQYIKTAIELRCWYIDGKVMTARRVTKRKERLAEKYPCRNYWAYEFKETPKKLYLEVCKAFEIIGLDFGAADILVSKNNYYFLELNSAASLATKIITQFFKDGLESLIRKKFGNV